MGINGDGDGGGCDGVGGDGGCGAGVVMDISPRIFPVSYIRIHFGYEPGT